MSESRIEPICVTGPALAGRASASQSWRELAFLHWRVDPDLVRPLLPAGTRPDLFDGSTWVGLIGFRLEGATLFGGPSIPYLGSFVEINVRLYAVDAEGRGGVVFRSLQASRLLAVLAARAAFGIPCYWSSTSATRDGDILAYEARRYSDRAATSTFAIAPSTERVEGDPLADFLTARWALYSRRGARTLRLENTHEPWELYAARFVSLADGLVGRAGLDSVVTREPDSVLYSPGVDAVFGRSTVVNEGW